MILHCIDPGVFESGVVTLSEERRVTYAAVVQNDEIRRSLPRVPPDGVLAIEVPQPRGMPTSGEEMETLIQIGRFIEAFRDIDRVHRVSRVAVKMEICGVANARDTNIRQAIIDLYGGKRTGIGGITCRKCSGKGWRGRGRPTCDSCKGNGWEVPPGPLYDVKSHCWSALAVGLTCLAQLETSA